MSSEDEAALFDGDDILEVLSDDQMSIDEPLIPDAVPSADVPSDLVPSDPMLVDSPVTKKVHTANSKFGINIGKSQRSRRIASSDSDTPHEPQTTTQKPRFVRQVQAQTASGPFAQGPSNQNPETSVTNASETMGFLVKTQVKTEPKKIVQKPIEKSLHPIPDITQPFTPSLIHDSDSDTPLPPSRMNPLTLETPLPPVTSSASPMYLFQLPNKLPEGIVGKLLVMRSGETILKIGKVKYNVTQGVLGGYLQDVYKIDKDAKKMYNLGHLERKYVCTPDIDSLLKQ